MKSVGQSKEVIDSSVKDKSSEDADKIVQDFSMKSKAARRLGCRKIATSFGRTTKRRGKSADESCVTLELEQCDDIKRLKPSPDQSILEATAPLLHQQSSIITSIGAQNTLIEASTPVRGPSPFQIQKFQLQLFPMDDPTRKCLLEKNHSPYLELTITAKKKISSVIRHLNIKWGSSRSASEELILFPYNVRAENFVSCKKWTSKDSNITAADVHTTIGKPAVFRLRYGWLSILEPNISKFDNQFKFMESQKRGLNDQERKPVDELLQRQVGQETLPKKTIRAPNNLRPDNGAKLSWVDCLSNMSFGALFSEAEAAEGAKVPQKQVSMSCDSFDAAVAAHISRYQQPRNQSGSQPSILDAEETCNPFSFHGCTSLNTSGREDEEARPADTNSTNNVDANQFGVLDMHWPPSTGPWQFLVSSSQQMINCDSNGLSGFAAASLDIF